MDRSPLPPFIRPLLPREDPRSRLERAVMTRIRRKSTVEAKDGTKTAQSAPVARKKKNKRATVEEEEKKKDANWTKDGKDNAEAFMKKYSAMGTDGIKNEWKTVIEPYKSPLYGDAAFRANPTKNRHKEVPSLDESRVSLPEKGYINASWMYDTQRIARQYILTQTPLESTIEDFWKMVFEHKAICIVVLCDKTENGQEVMPDFWPTTAGDFKNYGAMAVSYKTAEVIHKEEVTTLEVLPEGCSNSHITAIVQFKQWEATFTQSTGRNLLKIIRVISKLENLASGPVVVMDEYSAISRASILTVVDVMAALIYKGDKVTTLPDLCKWARRCRHGAIRNEDDYLAVIKTIFEYLYRTNQQKYGDAFEKICGKPDDIGAN